MLHAYSLEVPVAFKTLHQAALAAKGTVRVTQLDEQNKQNITAQLDFDVPAAEQPAMEKLLEELGEVHSHDEPGAAQRDRDRQESRLPADAQEPDPAAARRWPSVWKSARWSRVAAELANMVHKAKGKVMASQITHDAAGRAAAFQFFDVPLAAKDDLVLGSSLVGKTRVQKSTQTWCRKASSPMRTSMSP